MAPKFSLSAEAQDVAFAAADLLPGVVSDLFGTSRVGDTLRVEDRCTRCRIMTALCAGFGAEFVVDPVPGAVVAPAHKTLMHR